nr:hypothetical protein [uncultured Draconibacterium sp.]
MFKNLTLIAFVLLFVHSAKAQSIENYFADQTNQLQQKLYLNTDRELYFSTELYGFRLNCLMRKRTNRKAKIVICISKLLMKKESWSIKSYSQLLTENHLAR